MFIYIYIGVGMGVGCGLFFRVDLGGRVGFGFGVFVDGLYDGVFWCGEIVGELFCFEGCFGIRGIWRVLRSRRHGTGQVIIYVVVDSQSNSVIIAGFLKCRVRYSRRQKEETAIPMLYTTIPSKAIIRN